MQKDKRHPLTIGNKDWRDEDELFVHGGLWTLLVC
jgi:hypothetical protein